MTTGVLSPPPILAFLDNSGKPLVGGSILTQVGGVNTAVYSDSGLTTPLPNPVPLNSRGEVSTAAGASSQMFLSPNVVYTLTASDANNNQIWAATNVSGSVPIAITQALIGQTLWPQTAAEIAASVTPVNYQYAPGNVLRYGTNTTPGTTDMTTAFQNALAVAQAVYAPAGTYLISGALAMLAGQEFYGDGSETVLNFSAPGTNNQISANGVNSCSIHDMKLVLAAPGVDPNYKGAIALLYSSGHSVYNCEITGHSSSGILLEDASDCFIHHNYFHGGLGTYQDGADIQLIGLSTDVGSNNNVIESNTCNGGLWMGIIALVGAGSNAVMLQNRIANNYAGNMQCYGIALHTGAVSADWNATVVGNHVENINGSVLSGSAGAGIYVVGAGGCVVSNNRVRNCCIATTAETLAPAGIGISTMGATLSPTVVSGNLISEMSQYHGILAVTGTAPIQITGNAIDMPAAAAGAGIKINGTSNAAVVGNTINHRGTGTPILVQAVTSTYSGISVARNQITTVTGTALFLYSVTGGAFDHVSIDGNTCVASGNAALFNLTNILSGTIRGNYLNNGTNTAAPVAYASCTNTLISGNYVYGGSTVALQMSGTNTGTVVDKSNIFVSVSGARAGQNVVLNVGGHVETLGSAVPLYGTAVLGDTVYNTSGVTNFAWICTTAGSPGTWTALAI